jgi:hypothetical protein
LRTAGLTFLILLLSIHHAAAQVDAPDAALPLAPAPSIEAAQPELPRPHRVIDKKFIAVMGALGAAESMRFTTRRLVLENEMAAGAPWVTSIPSHTHLVIKYSPIFAAELAVAYELKKPHDWLPGDRVIRKLWWVYPVAMTVVHVKNSIGNIRTSDPSACPVEECQMP